MYKYPFNIIVGSGLGVSHSSYKRNGKLVPSGAIGQADIEYFTNVSNGSLVIKDHFALAQEVSGLIELGFYYNSLTTSEKWRLAIPKVDYSALPGKILYTESDGQVVTYLYNSVSKTYQSSACGPEGIAYLKQNNQGGYDWFHPQSGDKKTFDAHGYLKNVMDQAGRKAEFDYDLMSGKLQSITAVHSGNKYLLHRLENTVAFILQDPDGTQTVLQTHIFDKTSGLLKQTIVGGPSGYAVNYNYVNNILNTVIQADGTEVTFAFNAGDPALPALTQFILGKNEIYNITNSLAGSSTAEVANEASRQKITLSLNKAGYIDTFKQTNGIFTKTKPDATTAFTYNDQGQMQTLTHPNTGVENFYYGVFDILRLNFGPQEEHVTKSIDEKTGAVLQFTEALAATQPSKPGKFLKTRYVWDLNYQGNPENRRLRFIISPLGRVKERIYDGWGDIQYERAFFHDTFPITDKPPTYNPTLDDMEQWVKTYLAKYPTGISLTEYGTNNRGQISSVEHYSEIDANSKGIENAGSSNTIYFRMPYGAIEHQVDKQTGGEKPNTIATDAQYDALRRKKFQIDGQQDAVLAQKTVYEYNDSPTKTTHDITYPNGRKESNAFNSFGYITQKTEVDHASAPTQTRVTEYAHDGHGRLVRVTTPDKLYHYQLYDMQNRLIYELHPVKKDASGDLQLKVIEYAYDTPKGLQSKIEYSNTISLDALTIGDPSSLPPAFGVSRFLKPSPLDRQADTIYDKSNQPIYEIAPEGSLTQHFYNSLKIKTGTVKYAKLLTEEQRAQLANGGSLGLKINPDCDRYTRYFYDEDKLLIGEQDPAGYVAQYVRDGAGRITQKVRYAKEEDGIFKGMSHDLDFNKLISPENSQVYSTHYYFRDARGQVIAEIDAENYLTHYIYFANGKKALRYRFVNKIVGDPSKTLDWKTLKPSVSPEDKVTLWQYDGLNRLMNDTSTWHDENDIAYDEMNSIVGRTEKDTQIAGKVRATYNRRNAWSEVTAECNAIVAQEIMSVMNNNTLSQKEKEAAIEAIWKTKSIRYEIDNTGLKLSSTDSKGNKTLYYYDVARRPCFTINAKGAVTELQYNTFDEVEVEQKYAKPLTPEQLQQLKGGFLTTALQTLFEGLSGPTDIIESKEYNKRGQVTKVTDSEGYITKKDYNAFSEVKQVQLPLESKTPSITVDYEYDTRGNETSKATTAGTLSITESRQYNHPLDKETEYTNALGNTYSKKYNHTGHLVSQTDPLGSTDVFELDAFGRVKCHVNAEGEITLYLFDQNKRTITTQKVDQAGKVLAQWVDTYNVFHEAIVKADMLGNATTKDYAPNGKLLSKTNALKIREVLNYYNLLGQKISFVNAEGVSTTISYDNVNEIDKVVEDPAVLNLITSYLRDTFGRVTTLTDANSVAHIKIYDRRSLVKEAIDDQKTTSNPNGLNLVATNAYNGQRSKESVVKGNITTPALLTTVLKKDGLNRDTGHTIDPKNIAINIDKTLDHVGNIIAETDPNNNTTYHVYDAANNKRFTLKPNGGVIEWQYDKAQREVLYREYSKIMDVTSLKDKTLTEIAAAVAKEQQGNDRLIKKFRDGAGRVAFVVNHLGAVTQTLYDAASRNVGTYQYATAVDVNKISTLTLKDLESLTKVPTKDRVNYRILDAAKQERFAIDPEGYVTEQLFNEMGKAITRIQYACKVSNPQDIIHLPADQVRAKLKQDLDNDRYTYNFYDRRGKKIFEVNPEQAITQYDYDSLGNELKEIKFEEAADVSVGYQSLFTELKKLKADPTIDRIITKEYDKANRLIKITNAMGYVDQYELDAVGKPIEHTTRSGGKWKFGYDTATRLTSKASPAVEFMQTTLENGSIKQTNLTQEIATNITLDLAGNQTQVTTAAALADESSVNLGYGVDNKIKSLGMDDIQSDNPNAFANAATRPDATTDCINREFIRDARGNIIVEKNEAGVNTFKVYDAEDRVIFEVDGNAGITEYQRNIFGDIEEEIKYETPLNLDLTKYATTGLTAELINQNKITGELDQHKYKTYNKRGEIIKLLLGMMSYYIPDKEEGKIAEQGQAQPAVVYDYNAFGDLIYEARLISPKKQTYSGKFKWYDRRGNLLAQVDKNNAVIVKSYNRYGELEKETQYANPLKAAPTTSTTLVELLAQLEPNVDLDRVEEHQYDLLGRIAKTTMKNRVVQEEAKDKDGNLIIVNSKPQDLTRLYQYSELDKIVAITDENGNVAYKYYNILGRLVATTDVPRIVYDKDKNPITLVPLSYFQANAHGKQVYTKRFVAGTAKADLSSVPVPIATSVDDQEEALWLDKRGLHLAKQDAQGHLFSFSYTKTGKEARKWYQLINAIPTDASNTTFTDKTHTDEVLTLFDANENPITMQTIRDGNIVFFIDKEFSAFNKPTREKITYPNPSNRISVPYNGQWSKFWKHDANGIVWYSNEHGAPMITLHNPMQLSSAKLTSKTQDLSTVKYNDALALLDQPISQIQRDETSYDHKGHVAVLRSPSHYVAQKGVVFNMPINMVASSPIDGKATLSWERIANINYGVKSITLTPVNSEAPAIVRTIVADGLRQIVDVSDLPAGQYAYQIDFYQRDPITGDLAKDASYRSQGKTQFSTQVDFTKSTTIVPTVATDWHTVNLTGKTQGLTSIKLMQDDTLIKTIDVTVDPNTHIATMNLVDVPEGAYSVIPLYGTHTGEQSLPFVVYTQTPSTTPFGRRITCSAQLQVQDLAGQLSWTVPDAYKQAPIKLNIYYIDTDDNPQFTTQQLSADKMDKKGKAKEGTLNPNFHFDFKVKSISAIGISLQINSEWVPIIVQEAPEPAEKWVVAVRDEKGKALEVSASDDPVTYHFAEMAAFYVAPVSNVDPKTSLTYIDRSMGLNPATKTLPYQLIGKDALVFNATGIPDGIYPYVLGTKYQGNFIILSSSAQAEENIPFKVSEAKTLIEMVHQYRWDVWSNKLAFIDSFGHGTLYSYSKTNKGISKTLPAFKAMDGSGKLSLQTPTYVTGFGKLGELIGTMNANQHATIYRRNAAKQKLSEILADNTVIFQYPTYNAVSQLTAWRDARENHYQQKLDRRNLIIQTISPLGKINSYTYNILKDRTSHTNGMRDTYRYIYDVNRNIDETYYPEGDTISRLWNHNHQLWLSENKDGVITWERDFFGLELTKTDIGGAVVVTDYHFDRSPNTKVTTKTGKHGTYIPFSPYAKRLYSGLNSHPDAEPVQGVHQEYGYLGRNLSMIKDLADHVVELYDFDAERRKTSVQIEQHDGTVIYQASTSYNPAGLEEVISDANAHALLLYDVNSSRREIDYHINYVTKSGPPRTTSKKRTFMLDVNERVINDTGSIYAYGSNLRVKQTIDGILTNLTYNADTLLDQMDRPAQGTTHALTVTRTYNGANGVVNIYEDENWDVTIDHIPIHNSIKTVTELDYNKNEQIYNTIRTETRKSSSIIMQDEVIRSETTIPADGFTAGGIPLSQTDSYAQPGIGIIDRLNDVSFAEFDEKQLSQLRGSRERVGVGTSGYSSVFKYYNANSYVQAIVGNKTYQSDKMGSVIFLTNNQEGRALVRWEPYAKTSGNSPLQSILKELDLGITRYLASPNGEVVGTYGYTMPFSKTEIVFTSGGVKAETTYSNLDPNRVYQSETADLDIVLDYIQPVTPSYPPPAPMQAPVMANDSFASLASRYYTGKDYANFLANANAEGSSNNPNAGQVLTIPSVIPSHNYADELEPYWEELSKIIPALYPELVTPKKHHHHSILGDILAVVVTIVVMAFAPELLAAVIPHVLAVMSAAVLASTASQFIEIEAGNQTGFNFMQVFQSAILAGASAGILGGVGASAKAGISSGVNVSTDAVAAASQAAGQAAEQSFEQLAIKALFIGTLGVMLQAAANPDGKVNWLSALAQAAGLVLGAKLNTSKMSVWIRDGLEDVADTAFNAVLTGTPLNVESLVLNYIESAAEDELATYTKTKSSNQQQAHSSTRAGQTQHSPYNNNVNTSNSPHGNQVAGGGSEAPVALFTSNQTSQTKAITEFTDRTNQREAFKTQQSLHEQLQANQEGYLATNGYSMSNWAASGGMYGQAAMISMQMQRNYSMTRIGSENSWERVGVDAWTNSSGSNVMSQLVSLPFGNVPSGVYSQGIGQSIYMGPHQPVLNTSHLPFDSNIEDFSYTPRVNKLAMRLGAISSGAFSLAGAGTWALGALASDGLTTGVFGTMAAHDLDSALNDFKEAITGEPSNNYEVRFFSGVMGNKDASMFNSALDTANVVGLFAAGGMEGVRGVNRFGLFAGRNGAEDRIFVASHIRRGRQLLKEAGIPLHIRNRIIKSFKPESFRVEKIGSTHTEYRVFDDFNSEIKGRYVSSELFNEQTERITKLALPINSATRLAEVTLPKGAMIFRGGAADQAGISSGLVGGAEQSFLLGSLDQYTFQEILMPRPEIEFNYGGLQP